LFNHADDCLIIFLCAYGAIPVLQWQSDYPLTISRFIGGQYGQTIFQYSIVRFNAKHKCLFGSPDAASLPASLSPGITSPEKDDDKFD
jgi:hypothetical protein